MSENHNEKGFLQRNFKRALEAGAVVAAGAGLYQAWTGHSVADVATAVVITLPIAGAGAYLSCALHDYFKNKPKP